MTTFTTEDRVNATINVEPLEPIPFVGLVDLNKTDMTHQAIADELGVSRQTVAQIEEKALKKLRAELFKRGVDKEDLL
jgi:predicted DNA-binding protein (UPF0251 family)